jgi:hypothetical protein
LGVHRFGFNKINFGAVIFKQGNKVILQRSILKIIVVKLFKKVVKRENLLIGIKKVARFK